MPNHTGQLPFCDASHLPPPTDAYVAWLDVMGIQSIMSRSLQRSANFIFKIHIAALEAPRGNVRLYPVMDGIYAISTSQGDMFRFLEYVFSRLADLFVSTQDRQHRFLLKGALACGPVVHGSSVNNQVSPTLANAQPYCESLLLGMPMIQSHLGENAAPPFGVFIHESARAFHPPGQRGLSGSWWTWFGNWGPLTQELKVELDGYFEWCKARSEGIGYSLDRIKAHQESARQYLADVQLPLAAPPPAPAPGAAP